MNMIKRPRIRRPNRAARGKPSASVKVPAGRLALMVGGGLVVLAFCQGWSAHDDRADQAPFRPETMTVAEPVAAYQAPYGGLACGVDLDCSWVEHHQAEAAAKAAAKAAKAAGSKADQPTTTRRVSVATGKGGTTVTESTTTRTASGSVTETVRRGPKGTTVTRTVTSR